MAGPSRGSPTGATADGLRTAPIPPSRPKLAIVIAALAGLLLLLVLLSARLGVLGAAPLGETVRCIGAWLGLAEPLEGNRQFIGELRWWRSLVAVGVGAALALSGGLLQGVFRNDLASPAILGISGGAAVGASLAILAIGGYTPLGSAHDLATFAPWLVSGCAFVGAAGVAFLVALLATSEGRVSVPSLLLMGIAINAICGGILTALQSLVLRDFEVARAMMAWTFGVLDDRSAHHVLLIFGAVALAAAAIPFVAFELDLFAGGEDDAEGLGVDVQRTKVLALLAATLAASVAVAVAGQILFIGLIAPHALRLTTGRSHRTLLPLCLLGGGILLLGTDLLQRWLLGAAHLQPGVVMSLLGGPFFLFLLVRYRSEMRSW